MNKDAMFKIGYGLYVISAQDENKDNGCIVNTVVQVTDTPRRIAVTINNKSLTGKMISDTKKLNISVLSESVPFFVFEIFGFNSGKNIEKFSQVAFKRSQNNLPYLTENVSAFMSCEMYNEIDLGTHKMFICDLTDAEIISDQEPVTYSYYQKNIKPKSSENQQSKTGWRCEICGYVYEGEKLPDDFICPWCQHGTDAFVKI